MGAVKEAMEEEIRWAARQSGNDEEEILEEWNKDLRHRPENMISVPEFVRRHTQKKRHTYRK